MSSPSVGSPYVPGARSSAWVKHKHRRTESFLVTDWCPAEPRRPESLLLARVGSDGSLESAGSTPLVLADGQPSVRGAPRRPARVLHSSTP